MTDTNQLPPMPEPHIGLPWRHNAPDGSIHSSAFTADQMRAYALQASAQVQGEAVANVSAFGLVEWFTEPRAIGPCTLYTTPQPAQAKKEGA